MNQTAREFVGGLVVQALSGAARGERVAKESGLPEASVGRFHGRVTATELSPSWITLAVLTHSGAPPATMRGPIRFASPWPQASTVLQH
jgi:hypothetical protein